MARKILLKTLKVLLIVLASILLLVVLLLAIAKLNENRITNIVLNKVSVMIDAPVKADSVALLLLRKFPYATVEMHGFKMGPCKDSTIHATFGSADDTLVSLNKLYISINSRLLLQSKIEIEGIEVSGLTLNYMVDSLGVSNIDFLMSADTTQVDEEPTLLDLLLKDLTAQEVSLTYRDDQLGARAKLYIPELQVKARMLNEHIRAEILGSAQVTNVYFDSTNLHLMNQTALDFAIDYNDGKVAIDKFVVQTDGAKLSAQGQAILADSMYVDLSLSLVDGDIKELSKYAPQEMLNEFGVKEIRGELNATATIQGYVYDTLLLPSVDAALEFKHGNLTTADYPELRKLALSMVVKADDLYNLQTVSARLNQANISTRNSNFSLSGNLSNLDKPNYSISARGLIDFDEFASFIPDSTVEYLHGKMVFNLKTHGTLPDSIGLHNADYFLDRTTLDLAFKNISTALDSATVIQNLCAKFSYRPNRQIALQRFAAEIPSYQIKVDSAAIQATLLGLVKDMDNMGVDVHSYYLGMGSNTLGGDLMVQGLAKPTFRTNSTLNLNFAELRQFIPDTLISHIAGTATLNLQSFGTVDLDSIDSYIMPIAFEQSKIKASVRDLSVALPNDTLMQLNSLSLNFAMANDTMRIDNLLANAHGIDFWMDSTQIRNVYKAFFLEQPDSKVIVTTHITLSDLDYAKFAHLMVEDSTQTEDPPLVEDVASQEESTFIPHFIANGTVKVKSVKYNDILLNNLSTKFRVDDSLYIADNFRFEAFGGSMVTSVLFDTRYSDRAKVEFDNKINGMDIRQLLIDAAEFIPDVITYENVEGKLTSAINGRLFITGDSIHYDKIALLGKFKLEDGGIYNFEPAMELAKFTQLRELDRIVFRTLESSIFVYNNKIFLPKTDIVSSAIDISAYGMESFGTDYEYHLNVHLSDVLIGKNKKLLKKQGMESDMFKGDDKADRNGLFLVSYKKEGKSKHGFDTKQLQKMMLTTIKVHERGLNLIFHPQLLNFNTDIERKERRAIDSN